jgi:4-hydroxymandelate oxidase
VYAPKRITEPWHASSTRRHALCALAGFLAGSRHASGQQDPYRAHARVPSLDELLTAFDFEAVAHAKLPRDAYDFTAQGVESEFTLRRNREAFDWVTIVPKGVADVSSIRTETEVLGTKMAFPLMVAPTAGHGQLHAQGELATYEGCTEARTPLIVSNNSTFPMDKIAAAAASGTLWFQLYPSRQLKISRDRVERAQAAGARAIVVTMDQQATFYERQVHNRYLSIPRTVPASTAATQLSNPYRVPDTRLWYDWKFLEQIRPFIRVPVLIKGIVTPEDAKLCVEHGMEGIVVSNHGGRSLDYGPSTLEVLAEIVDAVSGRIPVIVDSGFRRGSDIFKALALGAKAVCVGRVPRWGLAAYGAEGVQRVLELLQNELTMTMAQAGRPDLESISRNAVRTDFP